MEGRAEARIGYPAGERNVDLREGSDEMADNDSRSWMSCVGWGCLTVVVLAALGIGGCVAFVYRGSSDARSVAQAYLDRVGEGRWDEAYELLGPAFTDGSTLGEFVAFEQAVRHDLGQCGPPRLSGTSLNREGGRSMAIVNYRLECQRGTSEAALTVEKLDGSWFVQGVRYREPGALPFPTCSACGGVLPPEARFCPYCGAATAGEADESATDGSAQEGPV